MGVNTQSARLAVDSSRNFLCLAQRLLLAVAAFCMLAAPYAAQAAEVVLAWDAVADSRVQMYEVYYGLESGHYDDKVTTSTTSATIPDLTPGATYYFVVRACEADGILCSAFSEEIHALIPAAAPTADFTPNVTSGVAPLGVEFTDLSTGDIASWQWEFGDGATSGEQSPSHTYTAAGSYTASLTVSGSGGSNTKTVVIDARAMAPVASFSASPTSGVAPLNVGFTDSSTGDISGWQWTFGDGATSGERSPSHTYTTPGTYTVTLTVTGPGGSGITTAAVEVAAPPPEAGFTASAGDSAAPLGMVFTDSSTGPITSWDWTFGDGVTSTSQSPSHSYSTPGTYPVSLTVTGPGGSDTATKDVRVGGDVAIEVGEVTLTDQRQRVDFQSEFLDPVVIVGSLSGNGGDPAVVRVDGVDAGGFWVRVQEWDYLDGPHTTETVDYLVMERGRHQLADGSWVEAGRLETDATNAFVPVSFGQPFAATPVVLASVTTVNEDTAVATRLRAIDVNGFQVGLREQEANPQSHAAEAIDYIAWQPASGVIDGLRFEVGRTGDEVTDAVHTISYQGAFAEPPLVLLDMQSTDGGDTANLRWQNRSPYGLDVWVDEEQSRDSETSHTSESVGYILMEPVN